MDDETNAIMTPIDLRDLLVGRLARATGGSAQRWRRALGPVRAYALATHPHCNWAVTPSGSPYEIETIERLLDSVRLEYPIVKTA